MTDRELLYTGLKEFLPEVSEKMIDDLLKFSALLLEKNKVMNLTAVTEPTEVVTRHFLDCAALTPHMPQGGRVLDVGTGAGFPGMPLAILCPETEFVLLDALRKRIDFLNEVIETLGLTNVTAVHARAEDFAKDSRASFDMAVSRAVADLRTLSELAVPMVKVGGTLVYSTCSILPQENEEQIKLFLARHPEYEVWPMGAELPEKLAAHENACGLQMFAHRDGTDGFYVCRMRRVKA